MFYVTTYSNYGVVILVLIGLLRSAQNVVSFSDIMKSITQAT